MDNIIYIGKLISQELQKKYAKIDEIENNKKKIEWGSQCLILKKVDSFFIYCFTIKRYLSYIILTLKTF